MPSLRVCLALLAVSTAAKANGFFAEPKPLSSRSLGQVPRLTFDEFRDELGRRGPESVLDRPLLIENLLSEEECESICNMIVEGAGDLPVVAQRSSIDGRRPRTDLYDCTFMEVLELVMKSKPTDSIFAFIEGLLDGDGQLQSKEKIRSLHKARNYLVDVRESLFTPFGKEPDRVSTNWLDLFPSQVAPTDCVVVAGQGAMSTFHRDPLEWTGTSICLEGRKIWRFLTPHSKTDPPDQELESYRLVSTAWSEDDNDEYNDKDHVSPGEPRSLSAGWQSNFALFPPMLERMAWSAEPGEGLASIPANELAKIEDSGSIVEELASNVSLMPPFLPESLTLEHDSDILSVVQGPGDMLLIPAYFYHQTYAPEPSIAVASQRCGTWESHRMIQHVLALQDGLCHDGLPESLRQDSYSDCDLSPQSIVDELFSKLKQHWSVSSNEK